MNKIKNFLIHPLFIYAIIACLECIPHESDLGKKVYHEMPKVGDNIQIKGDFDVFYYDGKGRYSYSSPDCYFGYGNPSWGAKYEDGGIKTIDADIAAKIPVLGKMCGDKIDIKFSKSIQTKEKVYSPNFLLDYFSEVSHFISYMVLSLSMLYHFRSRRNKYVVAFVSIFIGGLVLEGIQELFIPGRSASFDDVYMNSLGTLAGIILEWSLTRFQWVRKYWY